MDIHDGRQSQKQTWRVGLLMLLSPLLFVCLLVCLFWGDGIRDKRRETGCAG